MAVAEATSAAVPAERRPRGRLAGALAGLVMLAIAVAIYISLGNLGLGIAPPSVSASCSPPCRCSCSSGAGDPAGDRRRPGGPRQTTRSTSRCRRWRSTARSSSRRSPFLLPVRGRDTSLGFGGVQYGFDLGNFQTGAREASTSTTFLRTLRTAAVGTVLIMLVGFPFAY